MIATVDDILGYANLLQIILVRIGVVGVNDNGGSCQVGLLKESVDELEILVMVVGCVVTLLVGVTAKDGVSYQEVKEAIDNYAKKEGLELQHSDYYREMQSTIATVILALNAICIAIIVITIIIVVFVESLVIRAKIAREWRGMGISKALGQTSGGLITQIMFSNLPAILAGAIVGGMVAPFIGSTLVKAMFSLFAIQKVSFGIPFYYVLITIAGIIAVAILTSGTAGLKVRKIKAVAMITEE